MLKTETRTPALPTSEILAFWFGELGDDVPINMQLPQVRLWHAKDPATDDEIRTKFNAAYRSQQAQLFADGLHPASPDERLATVILFDQFSRNMFRDTPAMYETDDEAVRLCREGIAQGVDQDMPLIRRMFLYMPLMHAEDLAAQDETVRLFEGLVAAAETRSPINLGFFRMALGFASKHRDIVARFGRFPHRNAILGRESSDEEREFLTQENSAF